jgi:hypothetical protein
MNDESFTSNKVRRKTLPPELTLSRVFSTVKEIPSFIEERKLDKSPKKGKNSPKKKKESNVRFTDEVNQYFE